ncbi:MAG: hypothetical protein NWE98_10390 [Candidatus Bathyarchaeota archaeon]|nr:hypothetical protein [Candidatus Bathyarchaeota archaeon]
MAIGMLTEQELGEVVCKTLILYNRFRSPEATAKLVVLTPALITVAFTGSFCYSCGVSEYIEDLVHNFKALTNKAELKLLKTRQIAANSFEADYTIKNK